ncbi:MAG TPA: hypothetical protein VJY39_05105 [Acidisphaera sp.]|nr:hypothetical protein [Acidisphaera sp.]
MLDFLPPLLKRLYQSFRVPYARGTRVRETPEPDPEIAVSMRERSFRVEIIQDAFCERRPRPERLFRKPSGHRSMESWCDLEVSRYPTTRHRCAHCTETRDLYKRACDGDWQAEVRLHRLATRASMRLLAERRAWAETRRRQRAARTPEPAPPPVIWIILGWKRWRDRRAADPGPWFIVERRAAEAKLVRAHTRTLQRMAQRSRARARDRELARERAIVGWTSAAQSTISPTEQAADAPAPSSRGAQRRGDPGQRDRRLPRGPGSPRHQKATRDDDAHAHAPSEPPADAAHAGAPEPPAETAPPAQPPVPAPAPPNAPAAPAPAKFARVAYPPGSTTIIRIGAARPTIPAPPDRRTSAANGRDGSEHAPGRPRALIMAEDVPLTRTPAATRRATRQPQAEGWHRWPRPNDSS